MSVLRRHGNIPPFIHTLIYRHYFLDLTGIHYSRRVSILSSSLTAIDGNDYDDNSNNNNSIGVY